MRSILLISALIIGKLLSAQTEPRIVLAYEQYMEIVQEHHPLVAAADLQLQRGESLLRMARGGFDPVISGTMDRKDLDGTRYYDLLEGGLKIPTWLGISLDAGYTQNEGLFLNPADNTPQQGLLHAGISIPIGQGLFMDARRAELRKAEISQGLASAQRQLMINDLLLEAGSAYWGWFAAYHSTGVFEEAVELAEQRLQGVKQSALLGDRPYIDTLEASIQVQSRMLSLQQAQLDAANAGARLSVYLWLDGYVPMELSRATVPVDMQDAPIEKAKIKWLAALDSLVADHPFIQNAQGAIAQSEIDRQWKAEQLKPTLDLQYKALTESLGGVETAGFNSEDYTFGLAFKMPILLRKERGDLQLAQVKIEEGELKLADTRQEVLLKARTAINTQSTTADQVRLFEGTVRDYGSLLAGERELFDLGESSLFLVNSREVGFVQARIKLIELISKNRLSALKTQHALSTINTGL